MQIRFDDDFLKKQYKKLASAYRAKNIALMACHFTNLTLRYGGAFATELSQFIEAVEKRKAIDAAYELMDQQKHSGISCFAHKSIAKHPWRLFILIESNREKIRKREEAPEALAVDGAESSRVGLGLAVKGVKAFEVKLCQLCKTGILTEQGDCPECNAMLG
ncbi:TPA: hypothetical protein RQK57_002129 [Vibrio vulnificus]|nr:hypothetical protein [Vibrio vulnificus]